MIEFQNEGEKAVWRENLLSWQGMLEQGLEMADKIVLAYRARCPKTSPNLTATIGDPWPFNFCDMKPMSMPDIRIVEPMTGKESTNKEENSDGE